MAPFTQQEIDGEDWGLFQNGGVVLFRSPAILEESLCRLRGAGYRIGDVSCDPTAGSDQAILDAASALGLPLGFRGNPDAFSDYLWQIEFAGATGVILVLRGFDAVFQSSPDRATGMLDILADSHRVHLLKGNRFLTLVQSDNPWLDQRIGRIGGYPPAWNLKEWLNRDRGAS